MNQAVQHVVGTHDFRNLCKMDVANGVVEYFRRIISANVKVIFQNDQFPTNNYDMCELTIVGKAFLWHQIRCIVSVLILVGQHKENESVFRDLLNIENCPRYLVFFNFFFIEYLHNDNMYTFRKPQYSLACDLPLNLFDCQFENVNWIVDNESLLEVISSLQCLWATHIIK